MAGSIELTLRVELGSGVPCGVVVIAGTAIRFQGWLELLRCVEDARRDCTSREETPILGE